jgi:hypothetical protein
MFEESRKHGLPIEQLLKPVMIYVASAPESGKSFIIDKTLDGKSGISGCRVLKEGKTLNSQQLTMFSRLVMNPESYLTQVGLFRRFPSMFTFVIQLHRDQQHLDILMDITNPGWSFFHSDGNYRDLGFNWIGSEMRQLAKELFPDEVSVHPKHGWKRGVLKQLRDTLID